MAACAACMAASASAAQTGVEQRVAALEQRVTALEARLAVAEQETAQAVQQAQTAAQAPVQTDDKWLDKVNPFVRHAWVNEAWTRQDSWQAVKPGMTPQQVIKILGEPTRTVDSLKPKVDLVYFYEGAIQGNKIRGKVSFRKGEVVAVDQPDFE